MLVNFRFENYLSFEEMNVFTMTLGKSKLHQNNILKNETINLLKFAAVYGANASGKSNFISAIGFAQEIILKGIDTKVLSDMYNKNDKTNKMKYSRFEFEILLNQKIYSYGFSIHMAKNKIVDEWLYDITKKEKFIYTRNENELKINYGYLELDKKNETRLDIYAEDTIQDDTILFLTSLNDGKNSINTPNRESLFSDLFIWFREVLEVIEPNQATREFGLTYQNRKFLDKLGTYLKDSDTGVTKVLLEKTDERIKGVPIQFEKTLKEKIKSDFESDKKNKKTSALLRTPESMYIFRYENSKDEIEVSELKFEHGLNNIKYSLNEESDGTVRLVELFSVLYNTKEKVFVIDELDRSLHPLLTYDFVNKFIKGSRDNQLIISTHEDRLLDLSLLRRDEVWFVSKDEKGNSNMYSLEDYKERFDKNIMNAYLDGRYGAIPQIRESFSDLFINDSCQEGE